jgi:two-component system chemotaxis response regulator CheY
MQKVKGKKVLLVEDDDYVRQLVSLILRAKGYAVVEAVNGRDALDKLTANEVRMVITDIRMPQMDGLQFIRELRKEAVYKSLPVVVLTSEVQEHKKREAEQAGINGWILKPFIPRQLTHAVESLLGKSGFTAGSPVAGRIACEIQS